MSLTIISNDCWGNKWYINNKLPYNTPLIGTFIPPNDFVELLTDFNILFTELSFLPNKPITGILGNSRIIFLHYSSIQEAQDKWYRRIERLKQQNIECAVFKMSIMKTGVYRYYPTYNASELLHRFHSLPIINKISYCDISFGSITSAPYHYDIDESFANDAITLWNKTHTEPSIKNLLDKANLC